MQTGHKAKRVVKRVKQLIPKVVEILQEMNNSKYFNKFDIKNAYQQNEHLPESYEKTTVSLHLLFWSATLF